MLVDVVDHMLPTCGVVPCCMLLTNGLSTMGMQQVSVQKSACQRSTHPLCMGLDGSCHCLLVPPEHICCCATHVTDMWRFTLVVG